MTRYSMMWSDMWDDDRINQQCDDRAKLLYVFLISNHATNLIGYYRIPRALAKSSLGLNTSVFEATLDDLVKTGLIAISNNRQYVLIKGYLKFNKVNGASQFKKLKVELEHIERNSLDLIFIDEICRYCFREAPVILAEYIPENMKGLTNRDLASPIHEDTS